MVTDATNNALPPLPPVLPRFEHLSLRAGGGSNVLGQRTPPYGWHYFAARNSHERGVVTDIVDAGTALFSSSGRWHTKCDALALLSS
jgi:hypothetical protein